jgi:uncharacterized membrane protein YeiB
MLEEHVGAITPVTESKPLETMHPVTERDRIDTIDVLRGLAIFGILVVVIFSVQLALSAWCGSGGFASAQQNGCGGR